jgi:hypothetical protein
MVGGEKTDAAPAKLIIIRIIWVAWTVHRGIFSFYLFGFFDMIVGKPF